MLAMTMVCWWIDANRDQVIINKLFSRFFDHMLRNKELNGVLTGATWSMIGISAAVVLFPVEIAALSILFMTIGDPVAALVGMNSKQISIFNKSLEGSLAGFGACIIVSFAIPQVSLVTALIGALAATFIEILPIRINDNLTIPVFSGTMMLLSRIIV